MTNTTETAHRIAESIAALPPLPTTAQKILTCFGDEFIDADAVANVVEDDPAICARLLGLSNSSYFGLAEPVSNIREAISRVLGVDTVRSLVLAMAIQRSFDSNRCPAFRAERFWTRSIQVAECCKKVAAADEHADSAVRDLAYSTGLCHNLGLMALAHIEPDRINKALQSNEQNETADSLQNLCLDELNTNHRIVTAELGRLWSLPELMTSAYQYRAFPEISVDGRLGPILICGALAVRNAEMEEEDLTNLQKFADHIGLDAAEVQNFAQLGERQKDRISSLSSNMS